MKPLLSEHGISSFEIILKAYQASGSPLKNSLDGGAGMGVTARQMLQNTADGAICHAFEPFAGNHRFFDAVADTVVLHKQALAECSKQARFEVSAVVDETSELGRRGMAGYSSLGRLVEKDDVGDASTVQCVAADEVIPSDCAIDFVKLDLQGGELDALKGMKRILGQARVMWIEYSNQPGLLDFFHSNGFAIFDTQYMFEGDPHELAAQDFYICDTKTKLTTGAPVWFGYRRQEWPDYRREFDLVRYKHKMIQTDLVCVPRNNVAEFEQIIAQYCEARPYPISTSRPDADALSRTAEAAKIDPESGKSPSREQLIAHTFWSAPMRSQVPHFAKYEGLAWADVHDEWAQWAADVLRSAEAEGIVFKPHEDTALLRSDKPWWEKTARLAWLFWLKSNRDMSRIPEEAQMETWREEAAEFRIYVREVVRTLAIKRTYLQK